MAKIAFLVPTLHGGGAEFVARQWAQHFARVAGHDVMIVATHDDLAVANDATDYRYYSLRKEASSFLDRVRALRRLIVREHFDVVVALMPHWNVLALLATRAMGRQRPRVVISAHAIDLAPLRMKRSEYFLAKHLYRSADAYTASSHAVLAEAIAAYRINPRKAWVVPNPASAKVDLAEAAAARGRRYEAAPSAEINIVVPGRLVAVKRPALALEVAEAINQRAGGSASFATVHYFGTGELDTSLRDDANRRGVTAVFHGWVDRWFDEIPTQSVTLLGSESEGFGVVLVESAAYGVPSVALSRALGVADALIPGITGVLARSERVDVLATAIQQASQLRVPPRIDAWLEQFSLSESSKVLAQVLEEVARKDGFPMDVSTSSGERG